MVSERYDKRHVVGRYPFEHRTHSLVGRLGINHVTCQYNQVGTFGLQHFINTLQRNVRSRIAILEMDIGKLNNLELTRLVELQGGILGMQGNEPHTHQKQKKQNTFHGELNQRYKLMNNECLSTP